MEAASTVSRFRSTVKRFDKTVLMERKSVSTERRKRFHGTAKYKGFFEKNYLAL